MTDNSVRSSRSAGVMVPLFSCPSTASWGIGEIGDVPRLAAWLAGGGQRILQLLPLNEMAPGQQSPYSATSAMATDPIFITLSALPDFAAIGGEAALAAADADDLVRVRASRQVDYARVRRLKDAAFSASFAHFLAAEWEHDTPRARGLQAYITAEAWWLDDYALFRALHAREDERPWTAWPEPLRNRDAAAVTRARAELWRDVLYRQYLQWVADEQWAEARLAAERVGVRLFGDLPFMVDGDSADVWARQHLFRLDASLGVPPDAFSATGQDWGMPPYRWDAVAADDFTWLRERARRSARMYGGYRVDHLIGFYRTYARPRAGGEPFFSPADEPEQRALGERVLGILRDAGAEIVAEDLGVIPDFVRQSLVRLGVPGFKILRWERQWHADGQPFIDPSDYPACSVAASGTHDTETVAEWWERAPADERRRFAEIPTVRRVSGGAPLGDVFDVVVRDAVIEALFASGSDLLIVPVQDVFGWNDRVNTPATVTPENWTFRLPWPLDRLDAEPEARERQAALARWTTRYAR